MSIAKVNAEGSQRAVAFTLTHRVLRLLWQTRLLVGASPEGEALAFKLAQN